MQNKKADTAVSAFYFEKGLVGRDKVIPEYLLEQELIRTPGGAQHPVPEIPAITQLGNLLQCGLIVLPAQVNAYHRIFLQIQFPDLGFERFAVVLRNRNPCHRL